jgi:indole-3-glycerol phosphate synthase
VLEDDALRCLVDVAVSVHMSVVVECDSRDAVEAALRWPYTIIGVREVGDARELGRLASANRTIVLLSEIGTREEYEAARGVCDAVVVGSGVLANDDIAAALHALQAQS